MKLNTSTLFFDDVYDSEGKKLGETVNLVFDVSNHSARVLIFPEKAAWFSLQSLIELGDNITEDAIKQCDLPFSDKLNSFLKGTADKTTEYFKQQSLSYLAEIDEKLRSTYYLIPVCEIKESREKKLVLKGKILEYTDCIGTDVFDEDLVYHGDKAYLDNESRHKITLDRGFIKGQKMKDAEGNIGDVSDLIIDVDTSMVTELIVRSIGKGAGKKTVAINGIDFKTMTCKVPFG